MEATKERREELERNIEQLIIDSGLPYGYVMDILGHMQEIYRQKGIRLLNAANIQEVDKCPKFYVV